jgi:D-2-hydroxyacid dehydrogenase (NADP+)
MTRLLLLLDLPAEIQAQYNNYLRARFPQLTIDLVSHHTKVEPYIKTADILITFAPMLTDHVLQQGENLKWIQALGTGVDNLIDLPSLRPGIIVTNIHGVHGPAMSEAAIMAMLALSRDLPRVMRNQDRHVWERWPATLLDGRTVGILGVGAIGEALAPRCKAFGMTVAGISSRRRMVPNFDQMYERSELLTAVAGFDYLVVLTPYTPETRGLVNSAVFSAMKPTAYLINLARGGVVDEDALVSALRNREIAGAALDVFSQEPLPPEHELWSVKNVIVFPHLAGFHDRYPSQALPVVEKNLQKFLAGQVADMVNVVRRGGTFA